jgi:hypothetical protein
MELLAGQQLAVRQLVHSNCIIKRGLRVPFFLNHLKSQFTINVKIVLPLAHRLVFSEFLIYKLFFDLTSLSISNSLSIDNKDTLHIRTLSVNYKNES